MKRVAFKMQLYKGFEVEYKKRHDEIWPLLKDLLKKSGVEDYSIFLDENSGILFATLLLNNEEVFDSLPAHPVMRKWWAYMKDIMLTNEDDSPVSIPLKEVFHLP